MAAKHNAIIANPVRSMDPLARSRKEVRALTLEDVPLIRAGIRRWQNRPGPGPRDKDLGDIIDVFLGSGFRIGRGTRAALVRRGLRRRHRHR
jgi:hypothetical protein